MKIKSILLAVSILINPIHLNSKPLTTSKKVFYGGMCLANTVFFMSDIKKLLDLNKKYQIAKAAKYESELYKVETLEETKKEMYLYGLTAIVFFLGILHNSSILNNAE